MPASDDVDELDAAFRESMQELDDVVVVDEGVGELDERCEQLLFSGHARPLLTIDPVW